MNVVKAWRTCDARRRRFTDEDLDQLERRVEVIERLSRELADELLVANLACTEARFYDRPVSAAADSPRRNAWTAQVRNLLYQERNLQNVRVNFPMEDVTNAEHEAR